MSFRHVDMDQSSYLDSREANIGWEVVNGHTLRALVYKRTPSVDCGKCNSSKCNLINQRPCNERVSPLSTLTDEYPPVDSHCDRLLSRSRRTFHFGSIQLNWTRSITSPSGRIEPGQKVTKNNGIQERHVCMIDDQGKLGPVMDGVCIFQVGGWHLKSVSRRKKNKIYVI